MLTSPKHFPSRLALGGEAGNAIQSMRQLTNIFRRVYRIFAHAWFQHRDVFWSVESTYGLYLLFKVVCDEYHLIPEDSYTIPREAEEGQDSSDDRDVGRPPDIELRMQILRKEDLSSSAPSEDAAAAAAASPETSDDTAAGTTISTAATARRHRHTPSTGSHVATIAEGHEEDEEVTSAIVVPKTSAQPFGVASGTSESPSKAKDQLPRLDIGATVPLYEPRAPADPTPTGSTEDVDPLSAKSRSDVENTADASAKEQTPVTEERQNNDNEQEVTSPSGGSIRTGGPDLLKAILGHIGDEDDGDRRTKHEQDTNAEPSNFVKHEGSEADATKVDVPETEGGDTGADKDTAAKDDTPSDAEETFKDE